MIICSLIMLSSFYSTGEITANGESYNNMGMTAAHKTLPFNTLLKIQYNNKSIIVRVNDRGPFIEGRELDLSLGAALALGLEEKGIDKVCVEILNDENYLKNLTRISDYQVSESRD